MKKIILGYVALAATCAFAYTNQTNNSNYLASNSTKATANSKFQQFDRQMSIGYHFNSLTLKNGIDKKSTQYSHLLELDVERLFCNNIWANLNANLILSTQWGSNSGPFQGTGMDPGTMPASQDPYIGGVVAKIGYALNKQTFSFMPSNVQYIPFGLLARTTNLTTSTVIANNYSGIYKDFFMTAGFGGKLEYAVNNWIELYFSHQFEYNWDLSKPNASFSKKQNNWDIAIKIGAKYNVYKSVQVGLDGYYKYYDYTSSSPNATTSLNGGTNSDGNLVTIYRPKHRLGLEVMVGMTF